MPADRLQPSGLNTHFSGDGGDFGHYLAHTRAMLTRVHRGNDALARIEGNAPFELLPQATDGHSKLYRRGILLTHGLTDSPYHMRHLAAFFHAQGFRVMVPLLPGHGTVPGDLLTVQREDWSKAVAFGADCLAREVDELYLGGLSLGAALSLQHALGDRHVRGLFLFSPALQITSLARLAGLRSLLGRLLPAARWLGVLPDRDLYKYETLAVNGVAQTWALLAELKQRLQRHPPEIPLFAAASTDDTTVDSSATFDLIATTPHPLNHLVLYTTTPTEFAGMPRVEAVNSIVPAQRILSSAHTAIVIAPEDTHYGRHGSYANCLHYYRNDPARYRACWDSPEQAWLGEITHRNLGRDVLRRLMYNPHFDTLQDSLRRFIATLPETP